MYTPSQWKFAFPAVFVALAALAAGLGSAWERGSRWDAAMAGGVIAGIVASIGWALRHFSPGLSSIMGAAGAGLLGALCLLSYQTALGGAAIAAATFLVWFIAYDVIFTGSANTEVVSDVKPLGGTGAAGRALIVYHSIHGRFQPMIQRAFAEGLQRQGWAVDITTASRATPTGISSYGLLVLGTPSLNWQPSSPILRYLKRLGDLHGMPVVTVVSGGGMTGRAVRVMRDRVTKAGGRIVKEIEIWTRRPNAERHGLDDPAEIMRRVAQAGPEK